MFSQTGVGAPGGRLRAAMTGGAASSARRTVTSRAFRKSRVGAIGLGVLMAAAVAQPAQAAPPALARIVGEVERVTLDTPSDRWSKATLVVAGQNVIIPRNLLADLPANRLTIQQLFTTAPAACVARGESGLAKADACNTSGMGAIATIEANRTAAGNVIAGDMFIAKGVEAINGTVSFIDHTDGYFRINGIAGDPATGVMVRLNDPTTRHTTQSGPGCRAGSDNCSPDPRFTEDPDNYTQAFSSGYPMCIPSTVARTFTDTLDVNANNNRTETLTAQAAADGTGDVLCPETNRPASNVAADSRRLAPLQVGDNVTVQGNFETIAGVRFLSAWNTKIGRALSTSSTAGQPDYMTMNEMFIDAAGFDRNRARSLFIGATTEVTSDVNIWSLHRDPDNGVHEFPLASVTGCDNVGGAGTCTNVLGPNTWRLRHDVDFLLGTKADHDPCQLLRADPRFAAANICPKGGTTSEQFSILSPMPREVQARTGRKIADLARAGGPVLQTIDVKGADAPNGQYLFPMGMSLGGIEAPQFDEFNIDAIGTPTVFAGLPWDMDRRLSPNGCDGPCESTPQPLDPFPFEQRDPRTQAANLPTGTYNDPNYTASTLSNVRNRILSFVSPSVGNFDGDNTVLAWPPVDPPAQPVGPTPPLNAPGDITAPSTPGGVSASTVSTTQIDLSWTASTDNVGVTNYLVYRDGSPSSVAVVGAASTTFSDTGLAPGVAHTYSVQAVDAAGNTSDKSVVVTATTKAPKVTLTPTNVTFADQLAGTQSATQTITVTNTGDADLSITAAALAGPDAGDFAKGADSCTAATVAPAATCTVEVRFAPATTGGKTASLRISDDATGSPHSAALSGIGTAPPAGPAPAAVAPVAAPQVAGLPTLLGLAAGSPAGPLGLAPVKASAVLPNVSAVAPTVSAAATAPITVGVNVPAGALVVQIRVFQVGGATAARAARTTRRGKLIATVYRATPKAKRYTFSLTEKKLRNLKAGRYLVEIRVGKDRANLGPATTRTVTVKSAKTRR
jgi:hypothetical protein